MEYFDEQILNAKKQQKRNQYHSIETGFYIKDELVEFERIGIPPIQISLMLPNSFLTMPPALMKVKYQSENRPQIIKTSLDTSINFTFSRLPQFIKNEQVSLAAKQFRLIIQKVNPANVFFDEGEVFVGTSTLCWFDYKSYAVDEHVYNLMYVMPLRGGAMLHGVFNCQHKDKDEWKGAALQAILSIQEENEREDKAQ